MRALEARADFRVQRREYAVVVAAYLGAHRVGDDGEPRLRLEALDEVEDRRDELAGQRVEAHFDGDMHGGTSEGIAHGQPRLPLVAPAQVEPGREVRRLVLEVEAPDRIAFVEEVPHPGFDRPALGLVPGPQVSEEARIRPLVVARVEIETGLARQVGPRHPAGGMTPRRGDRRLPLRRMGEGAAPQVAVAEAV